MTTATAPAAEESLLVEYADNRQGNLRVDRDANVIRDVKIHGIESANGHTYLPGALSRALPLYEGAKVNVNHPPKKELDAWRNYEDRLGTIRNAMFREGSGVHGDLHYNPKHPVVEQLLWDAENAPQNVGFSPVTKSRRVLRDGRYVVEAIGGVVSVDLVPDPATSRGLYESSSIETENEAMDLSGLTLEQVKAARPDLAQALMAEQEESEAAKQKDKELETLREQVKNFTAQEKLAERKATVDKEIAEAKLPEAVVADAFRELCYEQADDAKLEKLLGSWKGIGQSMKPAAKRPTSQDQTQFESANRFSDINSSKDFAAALCR